MAAENVSASPLPVLGDNRIQSLDVVRGFALIGIFIMNVEYFNRATTQQGTGVQPGLSGTELWISYFVQYFLEGKFWTIFSLFLASAMPPC